MSLERVGGDSICGFWGHLEVLKWAITRRGYCNSTDAEYAVRGGHIAVVR